MTHLDQKLTNCEKLPQCDLVQSPKLITRFSSLLIYLVIFYLRNINNNLYLIYILKNRINLSIRILFIKLSYSIVYNILTTYLYLLLQEKVGCKCIILYIIDVSPKNSFQKVLSLLIFANVNLHRAQTMIRILGSYVVD